MFRKITKATIIGSVVYYGLYKSIPYLPESQMKYDVYGFLSCNLNLLRTVKTSSICIFDFWKNVHHIHDLDEYEKEISFYYTRIAHRIYDLCVANRGIYIKFAQYLSNLERVIPKEITSVLKELQDKCPPFSKAAIEIVLKNELGENWKEEIVELGEIPVGAASLAQVHKATLKNGQTAAVKIQYPPLRVQYVLDIFYLSFLSRVFSNLIVLTRMGNYDFEYILNKFKSSLKDEIDFRTEVKNSIKTLELFEKDETVKIPEVYQDLSTKRVITMEFVEGVNIDENEKLLEMGFNLVEISNLLIDMFASMIFINGNVHCDAHAGNIFVRRNPKNKSKPQIILLDHGFYRSYSENFRKDIVNLWIALVNLDDKKMKFYAQKIGIENHYNYLPLIFLFKTKNQHEIGKKIEKEELLEMKKNNLFGFNKIYDFIYEFPDDFLLILRTINLIAIRNACLGNKTRNRLFKMTYIAFRAKYENIFIRYFHIFLFRIKIFIYEWMFFLYKRLFFIDQSII
jgi:aarF domain-containing kinase